MWKLAEDYTIAELNPHDPYYTWQGELNSFDPYHGGDERKGFAAYDSWGDLIGSITWTDYGSYIYLHSAYVVPDYRGGGLFKEMLSHLPPKRIEANMWEDNPIQEFLDRYNQKFADLKEYDYAIDGDLELWANDRRPILMNDQDIFMGTPGGHHRELMEQILASDESEDKNSIWEKMQGFTAAYWVSKENAGKAYYEEPEGGFYFLANASTVRPEQIAMVQHYFPGEPIYAYNYNSDPGLWKKLAAGVYQIVEVGSTNPEAWDLSSEDHDAWVLDRQTNIIYYCRHGHHLDLMMALSKEDPDLAAQFMNLYGQKPDSRFLFGDIEYFGDEIDIHDFESGNRPAGLDQALVRFHKQAAGKIIQNVVDVPTDSDYHGDGKAFMILDDGNMYVTTSKAGHDQIMSYLSDQMEFQGNRFWDYMEEHILVQGRLNSNLYKLYYTEHPEVVEQIKEELAEMGYEEAGPSFYLGAANYKFVHVPSDRPEEYSTTGWLSLIVDTYEHIVYYGDPNKYHNSVIEGIEDLNGTGANDSFSLGDYDRWIPGEYNLTSGNVAFFAQKLTDKSQADLNLRYTIQQYFGAEEPPLKVTRVENPWHILRKPFVYNEETNTLIIGEAGAGFLYDSSFTLDTQVPNAVKEALVKLTINQAWRPMDEDDEGFLIDYWTEQPNYVWWTSWIWDVANKRLIIKNQSNVNHTQLLYNEKPMEMAVYGIITKNVYDEGRGTKWAIVPYYSDAAVYDESMPEFMDREISTADVDEAIEAVRAWLARVKHIRPENIPVHESSTKYADRFNREELVEYFVEALKGNRGDAQALKDMFGKMNTYWTQEEIDSAVDEAYVKYHEWFLEQARVREEFDRQMAEREAENPPESEVEIRWGYNRPRREWWLVPTDHMIIHPDMMSVWQNDWDWNADDVGLEAAFQNFASNFLFGYSSYNLTSGRYTYMSEDSYDLYNPDHELTEEEQATLEALVREFIKGYEKDENFTLRKVASDQPEILDLGARFDELVWVYNPEDDKLVIAPWNRLHASVIKEVWGEEIRDRGYKNLIAGLWTNIEMGWNPRVVYSDGSDEARFNAQVAMEALKNYVQPRLVTAGDLNNIEIVDTSNERHHGSGWPFLYDEKYDKLYIGNTQAFHSSLIESMGQEKMNDIWLRYYQEDKDSGEYDEEQPASVLGGRYDPENTYEPYMFYDFDTARGQADKWRIKELIDQAMNYIPHEFDEEEDDHVAKVATSPINDYEYQWHPLTEAELAGYRSGLPANERVKWQRRARRQNDRAKIQGKSGRVTGGELWAIAQRFENKCAYCKKDLAWGTPDATFDHVMPLALGGDSVISNIVPSCLHCNQELNEWDRNNNPEVYDPLVYNPLDRVKRDLPTEFQNPDRVLP